MSAKEDVQAGLPRSWTVVPLSDIADVNPPRPDTSGLSDDYKVTFVPMRNVEEATGRADYSLVRPLSEVARGYTGFREGDILFARITPCMENGKVAVAGGLRNGLGFGSTEFHVIRLIEGIPPKYVLLYLLQESVRHEARTQMTGSAGQLRVPADFMRQLRLPLPPLPEQHRIVAKLEELFTRLDAGVSALERVQALLERYRQAVLRDAFSGRLTAAWREAHRDELEPASALLERIRREREARGTGRYRHNAPAPRRATGVSPLPEGWEWVTLAELSWDAGYGTSTKCDYELPGPPVLRIPNIVEGRIDLRDLKFASNPQRLDNTSALAPGDMLVVRTNGSPRLIGRAAVVMDDLGQPVHFASYLIRYRLVMPDTLGRWVGAIWHAPQVREHVMREAATSAGQYNLSIDKLDRVTLPLPPAEEQQNIVAELQRLSTILDDVAQSVLKGLSWSSSLRQSILRHAFEGKLVPQDPNDEPADRLLERIRAESRAQGRLL